MALNVNSVLGVFPAPIKVTGTLTDGSTVDLTRTPGTTYQSRDSAVAAVDGFGSVIAVAPGTTSITVRNGNLTGQTAVRVAAFAVGELARLIVGSNTSIQDVFVSGDYAYLALGPAGFKVVDVHDRAAPFIAGAINTPANANDVFVQGSRVCRRWRGRIADYRCRQPGGSGSYGLG